MPLPDNTQNYNNVSQGVDRITEILRSQATPVAYSPFSPQATNLPINLMNALAYSSYDPGNGKGGNFMDNVQKFQSTQQENQINQQKMLLNAYEAKLKMGDAQTKALNDKIQLFTGGDPAGTAMFLEELHNDPQSIDPTNAYQVMTKLAGIAKKTGYVSPALELEKASKEADINYKNALSSRYTNSSTGSTSSGGSKTSFGKPPAGYVWKDDGSLEPIAGGPATKLSSEVAGRIGVAQSFIDDYKTIRSDIEGGKLTGADDKLKQATRVGEQGELLRRIDTGIDGLRRMLTGAGMPVAEAEDYVKRYRPEFTDGKKTLLNKVDGLAKDLGNAFDTVTRGHMTTEEINTIKEKTNIGDPRIQEALDAGYTMEEIQNFLGGQ